MNNTDFEKTVLFYLIVLLVISLVVINYLTPPMPWDARGYEFFFFCIVIIWAICGNMINHF